MSLLKAITSGEGREKKKREYKDKAKQKIAENMNDDDEIEVISDVQKTRVPIVTRNGENSDLNFVKQYKNILQYCNRDLYWIDNKKGSNNKEKLEIICVNFQTGMFEALKTNAVSILERELGAAITERPKVELYGMKCSEEKFCIDLEFEVDGEKHGVKLFVYNTKCSIGIQQKSPDAVVNKTTVAQYFYDNFITKVLVSLEKRLNISNINEHCRKLDSAGFKDYQKHKTIFL